MKEDLKRWLDEVLSEPFGDNIKAISFNLYDDGDNYWSLEVVGTAGFDPNDSDWACDEVSTFNTRENPFKWKESSDWEDILSKSTEVLTQYIEDGKNADKLKSCLGVGVGFVDGDIEIIYSR